MIREYRPQLDEFDLSYPQFLVMMSLWNKNGVFIRELSEQVLLDAATLTSILKRLEKKGFIIRIKSFLDERAKEIKLTKTGLAFISMWRLAHSLQSKSKRDCQVYLVAH
jgi:DNA-binding MarR family transcriptional regulator